MSMVPFTTLMPLLQDSAVKKGYFDDPFIIHLVPRAQFQPPRPPLINIGTYARFKSIDALVDQWLEF